MPPGLSDRALVAFTLSAALDNWPEAARIDSVADVAALIVSDTACPDLANSVEADSNFSAPEFISVMAL